MKINGNVILFVMLLLTSCKLGPNFHRPAMDIPEKFKEAGADWKVINPSDNKDKGNWWKIFNDPKLDELEEQLNKNNHSIKSAESSYSSALALVTKARVNYLPAIGASSSITKQKQAPPIGVTLTHSTTFNASWEPDFWGNISRTVESSKASAESAKAALASVRLSIQASLAQYYFELRMLDRDQEILDKIVASYEATTKYTEHRYKSGIADDAALSIAEQQLQTAKAAAINNSINRAQYQHAIAVLVGKYASNFDLASNTELVNDNISVPITVPSEILERRPDVAEAERQVAIASANIGIAKSAFFPTLDLSGSITHEGSGARNLLSLPTLLWSVGPQLALNITNLAAYRATTRSAKDNYNASVETYKNTVLAAFQDVEDNMVSFRILDDQVKIQKIATDKAKRNLDIVTNQYKSGTIDQSGVSTAQITYYNILKNFNDTIGLKMTSSVALIKALGGGWE